MTRSNIRVHDASTYCKPDGGRFARYHVVFDTPNGPKRLRQIFATRAAARDAARALRSTK